MTAVAHVATLTAGSLAGVLAFSGGQKLIRPFPASLAMLRFGLVRRVRRAHGRLAGGVEVVIAVALVAAPTRWWPFAAAAALGLFFVAIVGRVLANGAEFPCACFGKRNERVSPRTLARAGVLAVAAAGGAALCAVASPSTTVAEGLLGAASGVALACLVAVAVTLPATRPFSLRARLVEVE